VKKVATASTVLMINHYRNILVAEGIPCQIRNDQLNQVLGEVPFTEVWPELWVENDLDYDRAKQEMRRGKRGPVRRVLELRFQRPVARAGQGQSHARRISVFHPRVH
jgi:hypothetical protein